MPLDKYKYSCTWTVMLIAVLYFKVVSAARGTSILLHQLVSLPGLYPSATFMGACAPIGPLQPHTVHWAVPQEARFHLCVLSFTVFPTVLRPRVFACAGPRPSATVTRSAALGPVAPFCPASVNYMGYSQRNTLISEWLVLGFLADELASIILHICIRIVCGFDPLFHFETYVCAIHLTYCALYDLV